MWLTAVNDVRQHDLIRDGVTEVRVRKRFWAEAASGLVTTVLAVWTLLDREWLEPFIGRDVDQGSGALEVLVVVACLVLTVALSGVAWVEWRRAPSPA